MNNRKLTISHCRLGFIFLTVVFFLSSCRGTGNKQTEGDSLPDSLFINTLIERQLGTSQYRISIPSDYFIDVMKGADFDVYYFQPTDTTVPAAFAAGVYFGNQPSEFSPDNDSCKTEEVESKILGKKAKWTIYNCEGKYHIQTIIDSESGEIWNESIHAFGIANSSVELPKLFDIFLTLRKENE
ncbi:MAG: hypothetical protein FWF52_02555 [Candidatus Azobacteroides sp.]|nr:hypothetical protein [Candidatus Azobacteroides sp.]